MKLLKLTSEEDLTKSYFTNNLAYPLTVPKDCQVALKNITFQFDSPEFEVNDDNNTFIFSTGKTIPFERQVTLSNGVYKLNTFLAEIETKMNNALMSTSNSSDYSSTDVGFQWTVKALQKGSELVLNLAFNRSDNTAITTAGTTYPGMTYNGSSYFYKTIADDNGKYNAHLGNNVYVNRGGYIIELQLDNQTVPGDITKTNFIWGLDFSMASLDFSLKDFIIPLMWCCIGTDGNGHYQFKINNVMTSTSTPISIEALDILTISKKEGKICYRVKKNGSSTPLEVLGDTINNGLLDIMGASNNNYVLHVGNDSVAKTAFKSLRYYPNPNVNVSNGVYTINENVADVYLNTNLQATPSIVVLTIASPFTRQLLGFPNAINLSPKEVSGNFTGLDSLTLAFLQGDVEVEILEMPLDNYSQTSRQRRNIIMVISQSELSNSINTSGIEKYVLSYYEQANFQWMSLGNNNQELRFPALTVRATCNNKPIDIKGRMSATILYKPGSENN